MVLLNILYDYLHFFVDIVSTLSDNNVQSIKIYFSDGFYVVFSTDISVLSMFNGQDCYPIMYVMCAVHL